MVKALKPCALLPALIAMCNHQLSRFNQYDPYSKCPAFFKKKSKSLLDFIFIKIQSQSKGGSDPPF